MVAEHEWTVRNTKFDPLPGYSAHFVPRPFPVPERRKLPRRTLQSQASRPSSVRYIGQCTHRIRIVCTSLHRWVGFQNPLFATILTPVLIRTSGIISHHAPHSPKQPVTFGELCVYPPTKSLLYPFASVYNSLYIFLIAPMHSSLSGTLASVLVYISPPGSESIITGPCPPYTISTPIHDTFQKICKFLCDFLVILGHCSLPSCRV